MSDADAREFLRQHAVGHVGRRMQKDWPCVVPLMYVYEEAERLYLHTGARGGHFLSHIGAHAKICLAATDEGGMQQGSPSACNSSLVYKSAIVFGRVRVCSEPGVDQQKTWFFERLLERLGDARSNYATLHDAEADRAV
jgi:uncharacterized protein